MDRNKPKEPLRSILHNKHKHYAYFYSTEGEGVNKSDGNGVVERGKGKRCCASVRGVVDTLEGARIKGRWMAPATVE